MGARSTPIEYGARPLGAPSWRKGLLFGLGSRFQQEFVVTLAASEGDVIEKKIKARAPEVRKLPTAGEIYEYMVLERKSTEAMLAQLLQVDTITARSGGESGVLYQNKYEQSLEALKARLEARGVQLIEA